MSKDIELTATCVRVPTFVGHAISANVEFSDKIDAKKAKKILLECNHLTLHDKQENGGYTTPINCVKEDNVFISRLREDFSKENCLNFWIVADNLRKGAALNAVQIAEKLIELHL